MILEKMTDNRNEFDSLAEQLNRIIELFRKIESNKFHEYAAPTYKDGPALREMAEIILSDALDTAEVLAEKITVLSYLCVYESKPPPRSTAKSAAQTRRFPEVSL